MTRGPLLIVAGLAAVVAALQESPGDDAEVAPAGAPGPCRDTPRMKAAWEALGTGASAEARRHFAWQAVLDPRCAEARVGFALAASAMGDLSCGASSMRRALQVDPRVLADMHIDARLVPLVEDLVERSRSRLASDEKDDQGAALRASLACLLREEPPAHDAEPVVESGDPPAAVMEEKEEEEETAAVAPIPDQAPPARGQSDLPRLEVDYNKLQEDLAGTAAVLDRFTKKLLALHRRPEGLRQQASDSLIGTQ